MGTEPALVESRLPRPPRRWLVVFLELAAYFLVVIGTVATIVAVPVRRAWEGAWKEQTTRSLTDKARMFSSRIEADRSRSIQDLTFEEAKLASARATIIDTNGKVIADSQVPVATLESEGKRQEFVTALQGGTGVEVRTGNHLGVPVMYVAVPVSGGAVRLALPLSDMEIAAASSERLLLWCILGCALLALTASALIARRITRVH